MATDSSPVKRLRYAQRLFLWLLGYSLLLVGCFLFFQYQREQKYKAAEVNSQLQLINRFILSSMDDGKRIDEISRTKFHPFDDLRISLFDKNGRIIYDNFTDSITHSDHSGRQEIRQAIKTGSGYALRRHSATTGLTYFYSATRGEDGTLVRSAVPYTVSLDTLLKADWGFVWVMAFITLVMCVLGYYATRRLGEHITRLNLFARNVEQGARISDVEPFPHDELGDISNNIVRLYADLQQALSDRDKEHRAAMYEQQEKERIKKQLTNNINHELKTPVAAIRLCLETISEHPELAAEKRREFTLRALDQCTRLERLLADVSLITRMTDGDMAIVKERVNLSDIIGEAVTLQEELAARKGITIRNETKDKALYLNGNSSLLLSVFNNLIDNAIAYSGGTEITITVAESDDNSAVILLKDNGTGVGEEHLSRLFERFYRVDKGRSRAAGGTGLGLAIVKNAVILHGGSISVSNAKTGGLAFRMRFALSEANHGDEEATEGS